ncbi:major facilitator superfamily domain-containing protein [Mycena alexandri]|uniref:Major facilitator superfamily domain-containing protein n=1 Tax=Mycena alexandri TaxID=1745969 RepID=A0AAD6T6N5_9AGAR|nr:major facilitator superfamily domain-containing protein [Mycena alexandri]
MTSDTSQRSSTIREVEKDERDPYLIDSFEDGDPSNPKNWSRGRRWYLTAFSGLLVLNATFASAAPSGIAVQLMKEYNLSEEVGTLAISLFVAGYCVGPLLWGPLSEQYGRRPTLLYPFIIYTIFQVAAAVAKTGASLLVFRFLGGVFAAAPLTNTGAVISDLWDAGTRGKAMALFTLGPFAGPTIGPTIAGFIATSGTNFRWVFWVLAIFAGVCTILIVLILPETYAPVLLAKSAQKKREETGDSRFYAPMEKIKLSIWERVENVLARPFKVLFQEPMLIAITLYMSFVSVSRLLFRIGGTYPVIYSQAYPHRVYGGAPSQCWVFGPHVFAHHVWAVTAGHAFSSWYLTPRYEHEVARLAPEAVPPEYRLEMASQLSNRELLQLNCSINRHYLGPYLCSCLFWFGWTSYPSITLWAPLLSGFFSGFGISWIFLPLFNYIIDTYLFVAASALAANTVVRSVFGAVFPLFATQMYTALGPRWASSLLGFVALIMIPIPFVLKSFGPTIRAKSKYAPTMPRSTPVVKG